MCKGPEAGAAGGSPPQDVAFSGKPPRGPYLVELVSPSLCPSSLHTPGQPGLNTPPQAS